MYEYSYNYRSDQMSWNDNNCSCTATHKN